MLLLQEFDIEIRDNSGVENVVADHLSRIKGPVHSLPIRDNFPNEHLMQLLIIFLGELKLRPPKLIIL